LALSFESELAAGAAGVSGDCDCAIAGITHSVGRSKIAQKTGERLDKGCFFMAVSFLRA
jgi:hypothetical protein